MSDTLNNQKLKDVNIPATKKLKTTFYLPKSTFEKIDGLILLSGGNSSRNDIVENAIDFLFGYTTSQINQDYLCGVFGAKMEGLVSNLATRISRGNFRTAVEMDMLTRILATVVQLSKGGYDKLRVKSIHDVKITNGSIDILDAVHESESDNHSEQY